MLKWYFFKFNSKPISFTYVLHNTQDLFWIFKLTTILYLYSHLLHLAYQLHQILMTPRKLFPQN